MDFLRLENQGGLEALGQAMENVAALQRSHKITYRALDRGTVGLGISKLLENSLKELTYLPSTPAPLITHAGATPALWDIPPEMMIELTAVDREIRALEERVRNRAAHLRQLNDYLYQAIEFSFSNTDDDGFEAVRLEFDFGSLAKDRKLKNYYIDVIRWNREWLLAAEALNLRMEALGQQLGPRSLR